MQDLMECILKKLKNHIYKINIEHNQPAKCLQH
jgi:hypothetical protein